MADITITINTDGAAFDDNREQETARILRKLAEQFDNAHLYGGRGPERISDINGNTCGRIEIGGDQ